MSVIDESMPAAEGAIVKCLVLGERSALSDEQRRAFRHTGTVHLLVVSGLHVALLAAVCWWGMLLCRVRHSVAAVTVLGVVLVYAVLTGFRPSVQRAAVMCGVYCGGYILGRKPDFPSALALALIMILLYEPAELFSPGLQLSFAAVLGIVLFARPVAGALFRRRDRADHLQDPAERGWLDHPLRFTVQNMAAVSIVAWLSVVPLTMHYFSTVAPCAPMGNLVLMPVVWVTLAAGLPGVLAGAVSGFWAKPLLLVSASGAGVADWLSQALGAIPHVALFVPAPGWAWVALCGLVGIALAYRRALRLKGWRMAALLLLPLVFYLGLVWRAPAPGRTRVTFVAVGEGLCTLVQFPDGKALLFDGGSMSRQRVGERVIAPALWAQGVRRLECVVLSHSDADHYNGILEMARRIPVGRVLVTEYFDREARVAGFAEQVRALVGGVSCIGAGDRIGGFEGAVIEVLWPPRAMAFAHQLTDNELSAVVRIRSSGGAVLLTADIEGRGADMLLARGEDLHADILQVPHQGRVNPAGYRLAKRVQPRVAVISGGRYAPSLSAYAEHSGRLLATKDWGMIVAELEGEGRVAVTTHVRPGSGVR